MGMGMVVVENAPFGHSGTPFAMVLATLLALPTVSAALSSGLKFHTLAALLTRVWWPLNGTDTSPCMLARVALTLLESNTMLPMRFLAPLPPSLLLYACHASMATADTVIELTEGSLAVSRRSTTWVRSFLLLLVRELATLLSEI
jgi:hypothetical protein